MMNNFERQATNLQDYTKLINAISQPHLDKSALISLVDYTFLDSKPQADKLQAFVDSAFVRQKLAGICVYAHHLHLFDNHPSKKVTVINFPGGEQNDISVLGQFDAILKIANPDEIDYVFPYQDYLEGNQERAFKQCKKIIDHSRETHVTIKIIIESGEFTSNQDIYHLSKSILEYGPDFIKTSTGFSQIGATFEAATAICQAIKDTQIDCGIKVSGGIRDPLTACRYVHLVENIIEKTVDPTWFRIGASQLVQAL